MHSGFLGRKFDLYIWPMPMLPNFKADKEWIVNGFDMLRMYSGPSQLRFAFHCCSFLAANRKPFTFFALNVNSRPGDNGQLVKSKEQTWMLSLRLTRRCLANHLGVSGICPTDVCLVFQGDFIMGHFGLVSKAIRSLNIIDFRSELLQYLHFVFRLVQSGLGTQRCIPTCLELVHLHIYIVGPTGWFAINNVRQGNQ